jgi:hypothetical protein
VHPSINSLIEHEGERDSLTCSEGNDAKRYVIRINLYKHLEAISIIGDSTHREKEMRPFAQVLHPDHCHNIVGVKPTAAVAFEPKTLAIAGGGACMSEHARQPTGQAIYLCLGAGNGMISEPVPKTCRQIGHTEMALAMFGPDFSKLSAQPLVMIVKSTCVPVAAISRARIASNQGDVCNGDIVSGNGLDKVGH